MVQGELRGPGLRGHARPESERGDGGPEAHEADVGRSLRREHVPHSIVRPAPPHPGADVDPVNGYSLDLPPLTPNHAYGWDIIPIDILRHRGPVANARFQTTPEAEPCHGWFTQGGPEGGTFWVDIGHPGTFTVNCDFVNIPDIATVFDHPDNLLFTTGCVNHGPTGILPSVTSPTRFIKVMITPDCDNNPNETKCGIQIECAR